MSQKALTLPAQTAISRKVFFFLISIMHVCKLFILKASQITGSCRNSSQSPSNTTSPNGMILVHQKNKEIDRLDSVFSSFHMCSSVCMNVCVSMQFYPHINCVTTRAIRIQNSFIPTKVLPYAASQGHTYLTHWALGNRNSALHLSSFVTQG